MGRPWTCGASGREHRIADRTTSNAPSPCCDVFTHPAAAAPPPWQQTGMPPQVTANSLCTFKCGIAHGGKYFPFEQRVSLAPSGRRGGRGRAEPLATTRAGLQCHCWGLERTSGPHSVPHSPMRRPVPVGKTHVCGKRAYDPDP